MTALSETGLMNDSTEKHLFSFFSGVIHREQLSRTTSITRYGFIQKVTIISTLSQRLTGRVALLALSAAIMLSGCGGLTLLTAVLSIRFSTSTTPTPVSVLPLLTQSATTADTISVPTDAQTTLALALSPTSTIALLPTPTQLLLDPQQSSPYDPGNASLLNGGSPVFVLSPVPVLLVNTTPTAIGQIPACADYNGAANQSIRASVGPGAVSATVYCRIITDPYQIGVASVLARGVQLAVDIFALNGSSSVTRFNSAIYVCLRGNGVLLFLDANQTPRTSVQLTSTSTDGFQCANVPNAGTVVLVSR